MAVQTTFTVEHWNDPEIANLTGGELVNVQGYYEAGDGGGGLYQYFETYIGTLTPNGGTIVTSRGDSHLHETPGIPARSRY